MVNTPTETALTGASNATVYEQEAQLSNRAMLVVEVWQDFLSEYVDKKFTYNVTNG